MPAIIAPGTEVRPIAADDGTTQIRCPACTHAIPNVARNALSIGEHRPTADTIRCACPEALGTNVLGQRVPCPCRAEFRLRPEGMQRYVVLEGWQRAAEHPLVSAHAIYVPLQEAGAKPAPKPQKKSTRSRR